MSGECSEIIGMLSITTTFVTLDLELLGNIIAVLKQVTGEGDDDTSW